MKFHQLRDVIAVADKGSLRAASRHLNVSQSAMTRSIQVLEKEMGAPLFERQKRGSLLTPMGVLFVQRAKMATGEMNRAREEIQQHLGGGAGRVVASLSTVPHMALLPEVLDPFLRRYPDVNLSILEGLSFSSVEAQLRAGNIDFYVGRATSQQLPPGFVAEKLFENERVIVGRAGHPLIKARALGRLNQARWVLSDATLSQASFSALFQQHKLAPPAQLIFGSNVLAQMVMVLNSDMLAVVPRQWLGFAVLKGLVKRIPVRESIPPSSIVLIRRTALPLTPAAEYFCDLVRRASARMPPVKPGKVAAPPRASGDRRRASISP